ncbi:ATP-binding cassette domain-containing protein [Kiloniella laminariae]|uniref:ATP-binding cassette domain-containing protein n=1 Tax=Kiloniella laminariae TaxID=454162 RepID=A0ABT4LHJ1_9PROT|nr:ATP-binding cassette domain-containing protein [Kiloniella laminariae]MCZ4280564.1 ATP-binding cassette domain-containing protein [Kiloniella laminariae]
MTSHEKALLAIKVPPAPTIQFRNFSFSYKGQLLFDRLDLDLATGCWNLLLGRSGVGKTSLLRALAGLLPDTSYSGEILFDGKKLVSDQVSWMTQDDLLLPWLSVVENSLLGNRLRAWSRSPFPIIARNKAENLLRALGLGEHLHKRPAELSGGMRQRVALARTLLEDRPVVLLDEPFSALDALTRSEMQDLAFEQLMHKTVIMITHDPREALRLGHDIYLLKGSPVQLTRVSPPETVPLRSGFSSELQWCENRIIAELSLAGEIM